MGATRIGDTVDFFPRKCVMPKLTDKLVAILAAKELTEALNNTAQDNQHMIDNETLTEMLALSNIFTHRIKTWKHN